MDRSSEYVDRAFDALTEVSDLMVALGLGAEGKMIRDLRSRLARGELKQSPPNHDIKPPNMLAFKMARRSDNDWMRGHRWTKGEEPQKSKPIVLNVSGPWLERHRQQLMEHLMDDIDAKPEPPGSLGVVVNNPNGGRP